MKSFRLLLGVALTLVMGTISSQAHGCGYCFPWPLLTFGLGVGLGAAVSSPHYVYPTSTYVPAAYVPPPVSYAPPATASPAPVAQTAPPPAPLWVPSTPGAGHWVQDPAPYRYEPAVTARTVTPPPPRPHQVTVTDGPGSVRVYVVNR